MKVYIVWEIVTGYPEDGAGEYLKEIFANEDDAKAYCTQLNRELEEEEEEECDDGLEFDDDECSSTYYIVKEREVK